MISTYVHTHIEVTEENGCVTISDKDGSVMFSVDELLILRDAIDRVVVEIS